MATIIVNDPANITVDGVAVGSAVDVLENFRATPGIRGALLAALQEWHAGTVRAQAAERQDMADRQAQAFEAAGRQHAATLAEIADRHAREIAAKDAEIEGLKGQVAALQGQLAEKGASQGAEDV